MAHLSGNDQLLHKIIPDLFHYSKFSGGFNATDLSLVEKMAVANLLKFSFVRHPFDRSGECSGAKFCRSRAIRKSLVRFGDLMSKKLEK